MDNAQTNWQELGRFANAFLSTATKLMNFASQAVHIFQASSFCDPGTHDQATIRSRCNWNRAMEDLVSKVFQMNARALFLDKAMRELSVACDPSSRRGWPFTQKCTYSNGVWDCNYRHGLALTGYDWTYRIGSSNEAGKFRLMADIFNRMAAQEFCQKMYDLGYQARGFASGGLFGYNGFDPDNRRLVQGDCARITTVANHPSYKVYFGAIPSYCMNDDFPTCASLIATDDVWGDNMNDL